MCDEIPVRNRLTQNVINQLVKILIVLPNQAEIVYPGLDVAITKESIVRHLAVNHGQYYIGFVDIIDFLVKRMLVKPPGRLSLPLHQAVATTEARGTSGRFEANAFAFQRKPYILLPNGNDAPSRTAGTPAACRY
ncbi:MAG: hypothetical protein WBO14_06650 [Gammaproteobacteria bacterium]